MKRKKIESEKNIESIVFEVLKGSKSLGIFPTPIEKIVDFAELYVDERTNLAQIPKNYIAKSSENLKKALRKVRGVLDRREKVINLDLSQLETRKKFVQLHEVGHEVLPWQRELYEYLEDDDLTIDPDTKEAFEYEANYFASATFFQLDRFSEEMKVLPLGLKSAMQLAEKFGSSKHAAIRRYTEYSHKRCALLILEDYNGDLPFRARRKNYFQSASFTSEFGEIKWPQYFEFDLPFIQEMQFGKKYGENGVCEINSGVNGPLRLRYHFFNNTYNTFVLLMPIGEHIRSRTKIIIGSSSQ